MNAKFLKLIGNKKILALLPLSELSCSDLLPSTIVAGGSNSSLILTVPESDPSVGLNTLFSLIRRCSLLKIYFVVTNFVLILIFRDV